MKKKSQASATAKSRRRGADTRQRLLEAGIEAFARFGPDEVGIRRLALPPASIVRRCHIISVARRRIIGQSFVISWNGLASRYGRPQPGPR